jgi:hypothetical protein
MLEKIDGTPDFAVLLTVWNSAARKALMPRISTAGGAVRSVSVDDLDNVSMLGSERPQELAKHALRTMGFVDVQDVGLSEATTLAGSRLAGSRPRTPAGERSLRVAEAARCGRDLGVLRSSLPAGVRIVTSGGFFRRRTI